MASKSPVYNVIPVPIEKIKANNYNPNSIAPPEMKLLYESIKADGYTMPIVCYYVKAQDVYIIVDGFHRYRIMLEHSDIYEREGGRLPVSVIDKPIDQRMASTIRHNRARGSHDVELMSNIVKDLHELGRSDALSFSLIPSLLVSLVSVDGGDGRQGIFHGTVIEAHMPPARALDGIQGLVGGLEQRVVIGADPLDGGHAHAH